MSAGPLLDLDLDLDNDPHGELAEASCQIAVQGAAAGFRPGPIAPIARAVQAVLPPDLPAGMHVDPADMLAMIL